jgi:hypothetical protein
MPSGVVSEGKHKVPKKNPWKTSAGWQRQAKSSELGDGGLPVRGTIAKAFGLDAATRRNPTVSHPLLEPHSGSGRHMLFDERADLIDLELHKESSCRLKILD